MYLTQDRSPILFDITFLWFTTNLQSFAHNYHSYNNKNRSDYLKRSSFKLLQFCLKRVEYLPDVNQTENI